MPLGPQVHLPTLTFQADYSSVKGAEVPAEEGTEHYLPWWWIRDKFNHCQRLNTESRWQQLSQLFIRQYVLGVGHCPLVPSGSTSETGTTVAFTRTKYQGRVITKSQNSAIVNFSIDCYCVQNSSVRHLHHIVSVLKTCHFYNQNCCTPFHKTCSCASKRINWSIYVQWAFIHRASNNTATMKTASRYQGWKTASKNLGFLDVKKTENLKRLNSRFFYFWHNFIQNVFNIIF